MFSSRRRKAIAATPCSAESIAGVRMFAWTFAGLFAFIMATLIISELLMAHRGWTTAEFVRRTVEVVLLLGLAWGVHVWSAAPSVSNSTREHVALAYFIAYVGLLAYYSAQFLSFDVGRMSPTWVSMAVMLFPLLVPGTMRLYLRASIFVAIMTPVVFVFYCAAIGQGIFISEMALTSTILTTIGVWISAAIALVIGYMKVRERRRRIKAEVERDAAERELESYGSYQLVSKIGQGGMGEVWIGRHKFLKRPAAIKLLRPRKDHSDSDIVSKERAIDEAVARFEREASAIAMLTSPNTVHLYDYGHTEAGTFYFAMELLDGMDLDEFVTTFGPMPQERVVYLLKQACTSLAEAHEVGLVHRDIKPKNLFMCRTGLRYDVLKVLDFGLVFDVDGSRNADAETLTAQGEVCGTPAYMSPEQARRKPIDRRSDIYSLGAVAYYLLTGTLVFRSTNPIELIIAHIQEPPEPPSQRAPEMHIRPELDEVVLRCLEKDPEKRYDSTDELNDVLTALSNETRWSQAKAKTWSHGNPDVYVHRTSQPSLLPQAPPRLAAGLPLVP